MYKNIVAYFITEHRHHRAVADRRLLCGGGNRIAI